MVKLKLIDSKQIITRRKILIVAQRYLGLDLTNHREMQRPNFISRVYFRLRVNDNAIRM